MSGGHRRGVFSDVETIIFPCFLKDTMVSIERYDQDTSKWVKVLSPYKHDVKIKVEKVTSKELYSYNWKPQWFSMIPGR